jgi:hypothetical protein
MIHARDLGDNAQKILLHALSTIRSEDGVTEMNANLYLRTEEQQPGTSLQIAGATRIVPTRMATVQIFVDLDPLANWGHPVRFLYYALSSAQLVHSEYASFPPHDFDTDPAAYEPIHVPQVFQEAPRVATERKPGLRFFLRWPRFGEERRRRRGGKRYAILFSGNSNNRHLNDLEFLYRTLIDQYKFEPRNVRVLNFDGTLNYNGGPQPVTTWPGNGTPYRLKGRIDGPGDVKGFDAAFNWVILRLKPDDLLLIHTNNHGGQNDGYGQPWLCGYPNFSLVYKASDFGARIKALPKHKSLIVGMEQCYSGAFMGPTINNSRAHVTSFASAVPANLSSMGGPTFDPWARDWIAAFHGANPDGTALSLPVPTNPATRAAFNYSNAAHVPGDLPQFQDAPPGSGNGQHL